MEEYACVLDILPEGRPDDKRRFRREAMVYGLGVEEFKIFEMAPIPGVPVNIGDRVFIGKETGERKQIERVRARVSYADLTHTAQSELGFLLEELVREQEEKFVEFYNHLKYHKTLKDVTPYYVLNGRLEAILAHRKEVQRETFDRRRRYNQEVRETLKRGASSP